VSLAALVRNWWHGGEAARAEEFWRTGIALRAIGNVTGARRQFERSLVASPANAKWQNEYGLTCLALDDMPSARIAFEAALAIDPRLAEAHCNLGMLTAQLGVVPAAGDAAADLQAEALRHFQRAAELDSGLLPAQYNSGLLRWKMGEPEIAIICLDAAQVIDAQSAEVQRTRGFVLQELRRFDEAEASLLRALAARPDDAEARLSLGYLRLMQGDYAQGWRDYEARYATGESPRRAFACPDWTGGPLTGASLLVYAEQGVGDEILFASCITELAARARQVVLDCEPRLEKLFARSFPQVTVRGGPRTANPPWLAGIAAPDCKIAAGSVPQYLRTASEDFPLSDQYLVSDPARTAVWKQRVNDCGRNAGQASRLNVGLAWRGGLPQTGDAARSLQLAGLLPALQLNQVNFVSLQHDASAAELDEMASQHAVQIQHWPEAHADFDETAALIMALDLVITVRCSLVHLAGALGKATWVLTPSVPDWRYPAHGDGMPWHRSVRLLRQDKRGEWNAVVSSLREQLARMGAPANDSLAPAAREQ
jgi:tetratricopeptide (TPR) repeat protein